MNIKNYQKILVAVDVFEPHEAIIQQAKTLHDKFGATLHFIYVLPVIVSTLPYTLDAQEEIKKDSETKLTTIAKACHVADNIHTCYGNPKNEITKFAAKIQADLILINSHGKHGIDLIIGSTANGVLHTATCDVLTVRVNNNGQRLTNNDYKNITIAADLEADNVAVIGQAKVLADAYNAELHMINVVPCATTIAAAYYPNIDMEIKKSATETLQGLAQKSGIKPNNTNIVVGIPRNEVNAFAKSTKSELIVIGNHGRNAFNSALLGSTANALLHTAEQDILVVHLKH